MAKTIKLYRGVSATDYKLASASLIDQNRKLWRDILQLRSVGDFNFPKELSQEINKLQRNQKLERQYFTDRKEIARSYAAEVNGLLVEITVPIVDVLKNFNLEFQNFGLRKKTFEIVYCVPGKVLNRRQTDWKMRVRKI